MIYESIKVFNTDIYRRSFNVSIRAIIWKIKLKHPHVSTPLLPGSEKKREWCQKGCLNQLKIEQWVAYRLIIIATRAFRARLKSYGFRAIRGWVNILADFQKRRISKVICFEAKLTFAVFFPINKWSPNFYFFTRL